LYTYFLKWVIIVLGPLYLPAFNVSLWLSHLALVLFRQSPIIHFYVSRCKKWIPINISEDGVGPFLYKRSSHLLNLLNPTGKHMYHLLWLNPLNAELNPTSHLLALLGAHHIFHVSGLRVKDTLHCSYTPLLCVFIMFAISKVYFPKPY